MEILASSAAVAARGADLVVETLCGAIADRGRASLVLAGGTTPNRLYGELAERATEVEWDRVAFALGDERLVPRDHPDSNFKMACDRLLGPLGLAPDRLLAPDPRLPPAESAASYDKRLRQRFGPAPRWDCVLLGLGSDGHTASLFPGGAELEESRRLAVASRAPQPPVERVTLTLGALRAARSVLFLVTGRAKAPALARCLDPESTAPAAAVPGATWLVDAEAAPG